MWRWNSGGSSKSLKNGNESLNQSKKSLSEIKQRIKGRSICKESHTRFNLPRTCKMSIFVLNNNKKKVAQSRLPIFSHLLAKCQSYKLKILKNCWKHYFPVISLIVEWNEKNFLFVTKAKGYHFKITKKYLTFIRLGRSFLITHTQKRDRIKMSLSINKFWEKPAISTTLANFYSNLNDRNLNLILKNWNLDPK